MKHSLRPRYLSCLILVPALLLGGAARAERIYKWVDENGEIQYGDRVPPRYSSKERSVIDDQGRTVKVYEAAKTPEQKAEADALAKQEAERKKLAAQQAVLDHSLLATYSSEGDLLQARDSKIATVANLIELTNSSIDSFRKRLNELTGEAAEFERSGKKLPEGLASQIKNIKEQIKQKEAFVDRKKKEKEKLTEKFDQDLVRYRELTAKR